MAQVRISIDGVVYTADFKWGFDEYNNPTIVLGPPYQGCLTLVLEPHVALIGSIRSTGTCPITPPLPSHGVLNILVPLGIELCLRYRPRVEIDDAASIPLWGGDTVWLSIIKIVTGTFSTTYSKYGFYSDDLPQTSITNQSAFFLTHTGYNTTQAYQDQLTALGIPLNLSLSEIAKRLLEQNAYFQFNELYTMFFDTSDSLCVLDLAKWSEYKHQHGIHLVCGGFE